MLGAMCESELLGLKSLSALPLNKSICMPMCVNFAVTEEEMGFRILINSSNSIFGITRKQIKNSQYSNGFYKNALENTLFSLVITLQRKAGKNTHSQS